ncbi:MAG TPA: SpoIVB peptidase S55 domain-containing protein [Bryobacteraceae bacterium]|nr:SpoIVB peptidase S55 domain-containing protein [Bryobacteraceae bacterium]
MGPFRIVLPLLAVSAASIVRAAPAIFPLKDVRAGQHGIGRTVFNGSRVEEFQVEILGVLENLGPRESIILARLKGGPLENTGVMQGMSGSPVYIDGKLAGAIALSFPLSKEAIAGIRPIEDMLRVEPRPARDIASATPPPRRRPFMAGETRLEEIATPVSFSGFTAATLEHFAPQLRELGWDPRQGISGGGAPSDRLGDPRQIEPGSMISVQLLSGDMSVGADGTITAIDGDRVYAFGHRFLAEGSTDLPFARAEVLALLPNLSSSFKISTAREWMGAITADRDTAISGLTGKQAKLIPVEIRVGQNIYRMRMIQDRVMTPLLAQMAIFSAIDATERSIGSQTFSVRGRLDFAAGPVRVDDVYSGDVAVAAIASAGVSTPLAYAFQSGFDALKLESIALDIGVVEKRGQQQIADLIAPRTVHPGDEIELTVVLAGDSGAETSQRVRYRVPVGAPAGPLSFTVSDATSTNLLEFQSVAGTPQRSSQQVLNLLNGFRSNTKAYLRVWRSEPSFTIEGRDLPAPPPSLAMILSRGQQGTGNLLTARGATLAEIEIPAGAGVVVTGSKTAQVHVRE